MERVDYLIVGQGIAGTFLAHGLNQKNLSFKVVDKGYKHGSSHVAAGIINPLVLKRLTKTWRVNDFVEYNKLFYPKLNRFLSKKVHKPISLFKLISSDDESTFWKKRSKEDELDDYINEGLSKAKLPNVFTEPFFVGKVKHTSWVDIKRLLSEYRLYLKANDKLIQESFDYSALEFKKDRLLYHGVSAKKIIFCEGSMIGHNPFFNYLPMGLNKGELITIESQNLQLNSMYKKKVFILPRGNDIYKVGATFEWEWESNSPSKHKRQELIDSLNKLIKVPYKIINHEAGIRPSVRDRRPLMGPHPENEKLVIFNGLGSRGCLMGPLLSEELINHLENNTPLNRELSISRFNKHLS